MDQNYNFEFDILHKFDCSSVELSTVLNQTSGGYGCPLYAQCTYIKYEIF